MPAIEALRRFYARCVAAAVGSSDPRLIDAFGDVPREDFVGPGPWLVRAGSEYVQTPDNDPAFVYQDVLIALDAARGVNNGQPTLHAHCIAACAPGIGEVVLHVGSGTGYYTAILSKLVGPAGRVIAYEIDAALAARARENLRHFDGVAVVNESATAATLPQADVIYVNAGVTAPVPGWLDALSVGGRLIVPLTADDWYGWMLLVTREHGDRFSASAVCRVGIIPCVGARSGTEAAALAAAFQASPIKQVRSLVRGTRPDESCWYPGDGWWLSTRPVRGAAQDDDR